MFEALISSVSVTAAGWIGVVFGGGWTTIGVLGFLIIAAGAQYLHTANLCVLAIGRVYEKLAKELYKRNNEAGHELAEGFEFAIGQRALLEEIEIFTIACWVTRITLYALALFGGTLLFGTFWTGHA